MTSGFERVQMDPRSPDPTRPLPVRPRPENGEATAGYLIRIAAANGYCSPRQLWTALSERSTGNRFADLCERLNLAPEERSRLFGPCPRYWGDSNMSPGLASIDFNHDFLRWCPRCLGEAAYVRSSWTAKLCCVCPKHSVFLCDRCPQCGVRQRPERGDVRTCNCGARLDASTVQFPSKALLHLNNAMEGSVAEIFLLPPIQNLTAADLRRLIRYLGQFTEKSQPARPGQIAGLSRLEVAISVMEGAADLLDEWPRNFLVLLDALNRESPAISSMRRTFGRLYRVLYADLHAANFQFLRDVFEDYLHQHWWGHVRKRNRWLKVGTVVNHPRLTLDQVATDASVAPALVRHLVQAEFIKVCEIGMPSGRRSRSIHQADVARIAAIGKETVTLTEAACLLSLPKGRVRELIDGEVIEPLISRSQIKSASWLIPRAQLQRLWFTGATAKSGASIVSMKHVLQYWRLMDGEFAAMVVAMLSRVLIPMQMTYDVTAIGNLFLDTIATQHWLGTHRTTSGNSLSVDQAARVLGLKQEVAYGLVRGGFLQVTSSGRNGVRISQDNLRTFREQYVSLADLARKYGRSSKWMLGAIAALPVCGPSVDGSRQYFFRRSEVEAKTHPT